MKAHCERCGAVGITHISSRFDGLSICQRCDDIEARYPGPLRLGAPAGLAERCRAARSVREAT